MQMTLGSKSEIERFSQIINKTYKSATQGTMPEEPTGGLTKTFGFIDKAYKNKARHYDLKNFF